MKILFQDVNMNVLKEELHLQNKIYLYNILLELKKIFT